jgi:hypothetical protein
MSDRPADGIDTKVINQPVVESQSERESTETMTDLKRADDGQLSMRVKVHSPSRNYYDGPAFSISAENTTGPFDILPKHHNFISLLSPCDLTIRTTQQGAQKVRIAGGIMHVKADEVIVFLDV